MTVQRMVSYNPLNLACCIGFCLTDDRLCSVSSNCQLNCESYNTHTHTFSGPLSRTTWVSPYQNGKTNLDFTEARDSEWQWHQLGHMQVCTSLRTDNHASTSSLSFLQAGCPSCHPANSVQALKAQSYGSRMILFDGGVCIAHR